VHGIIAQFKTHIQEDQKTGGHSHGKPDDIDQGKYPVSPEIPECDFEIALEHAFYSWQLVVGSWQLAAQFTANYKLSTAN
jgi:hypothetical protein